MIMDKKSIAESVFQQYKENLEIMKTDLHSWDRRTLPAMSMRVQDAKQQNPKLREMFLAHLFDTAYSLYLSGNVAKQKQFLKVIEETFENIVPLNGMELYEGFAQVVEPSLGDRRDFGPTQIVLLTRALEEELYKNDRILFTAPTLNDVKKVSTFEELSFHCRDLIEQTNSKDPLRSNLERRAVEVALSKDSFEPKTLYVIAQVEKYAEFGPTFLGGRFIDCNVDTLNVIDKDTVLEVLKKVKKK